MPDARTPLRLLIILPNWVGDVVMATPALRLLRTSFPGSFIGALARPGIDQLLEGTDFVDELHIERGGGVFGPKFMAAKVRPRRYECALLLTNSFSTALVARIAGIPRRVGYNRDGRGFLLTEKLAPPTRADGQWAIIPACQYYWNAASSLLRGTPIPPLTPPAPSPQLTLPPDALMHLASSPQQVEASEALLARALPPNASGPIVVLNPGANNPAKRWPAANFAQLADYLAEHYHASILINGSQAESPLVDEIISLCRIAHPASLPALGITLGTLKHILTRAALLVTNDTGPRHIARAMGTPVIGLFGPTDHRWTLLPRGNGFERIIVADPTLPADQSANDHPQRCAIDRIELPRVIAAIESLGTMSLS